VILRDSRYEPTPLYQDGRDVFLGTRQPISLAPSDDDRFVAIGLNERIDGFAYRVWGTALGEAASRLWWVLCDVNDLVSPFAIPAGTVLRVPSPERIALEVLG
jgi:hypothetical protein